MRLLTELRAEHVRIERTLGALRTYAHGRARGEHDPRDAERFLTFFRLYADAFHHAREEDVLFTALARELELPRGEGPMAVLTEDHHRMRAQLGEIATLLGAELDPAAGSRLEALVVAYSHALLHHIDAENSVLFPESEARLLAASVRELPGRGPTEDEARAGQDGDALSLRYPPTHDPDLIRGEGCILCPAYGVSCRGLEREWWNDSEWEEHPGRVGHD